MTDSLQSLIHAVDAADSAAKLVKAVRALAATGDERAVPTLIATLSYNNPGAAVAAVDGLTAIGEPAVPALLDQLDQHNYTARAWAIRTLAGVGDPRGLPTLLGAVTADFAVSVRRAAARGLGTMKWHGFPADLLEVAQEEALDALLFAATEDDEWVVRYSAVVGLQSLAIAISHSYPNWLSHIRTQIGAIANHDDCLAVRARCIMAQRHIEAPPSDHVTTPVGTSSELSDTDWQKIMTQLYARKAEERQEFPEGDPRRFKAMVTGDRH